MNLYSYVSNNPLNLIDPMGMEKEKEDEPDCSKSGNGIEYNDAEDVLKKFRENNLMQDCMAGCHGNESTKGKDRNSDFDSHMGEILENGYIEPDEKLKYLEAVWLWQNGESTPIWLDGRELDTKTSLGMK